MVVDWSSWRRTRSPGSLRSLGSLDGSEEVDEGTGEVADEAAQQRPGLSPHSQRGRAGLAGDGGQQEPGGEQAGGQHQLHRNQQRGGKTDNKYFSTKKCFCSASMNVNSSVE